MDSSGSKPLPNTKERAVWLVLRGSTVDEAVLATQNPCSASHLYKLVRAKKEEIKASARAETLTHLNNNATDYIITTAAEDDTTISELTPSPAKRTRKKKTNKTRNKIMVAALNGVKEGLGEFVMSTTSVKGDKRSASDSSLTTIEKRPRKTSKQKNYDDKITNQANAVVDARYKEALKLATTEYVQGQDPASNVKKISYAKVADKYNEEKKLPPFKQLKTSTVQRYVKDHKLVGKSPLKKGPSSKVPLELWDILDAQVSMSQLEGKVEMQPRLLKGIIGATIKNTQFGDMNIEYLYGEFRRRNADTVAPTAGLECEARRSEWTVYPNVKAFLEGGKDILIKYGFATEAPQKVRDIFAGKPLPFEIDENLTSGLTFKYEVLHRIINMDETHHCKGSQGDKSGSRRGTLTNPNLPRFGTRVGGDSGHVTGVYGTTPLEPMPPIYIYPSGAKDKEKMKVRPEWADGLPKVTGKWGLTQESMMDSHVCARPSGSMDEDLFMITVLFYKSLYDETLSPTFVWDSDGNFVKGPVLFKVDSGQGREGKSERHIKFIEDMHREGFYILPGLPNSTSVTQEMDAFYQLFKGESDAKVRELFIDRLYERARALEMKESGDYPDIVIPPAHLTHADMSAIVNGKMGDPIEKRPFDYCFTLENIFKSWLSIGFVPYTMAALEDKELRHMLGDGGASDRMKERLEAVQKRYDELKVKVRAAGLNDCVFRSSIPVHKKIPALQKTEDEQVESLVKHRKAFSSGAKWLTCGTHLMGSSAVIRAKKQQIKEEKEGNAEAAAKKKDEARKKMNAARESLLTIEGKGLGKPIGDDWKSIIMFIIPRLAKEVTAPSKINTIQKAKDELERLREKYQAETWNHLVRAELEKANNEFVGVGEDFLSAASANDGQEVQTEAV